MKRLLALVVLCCIALTLNAEDLRLTYVDFFLLVDTSLSMVEAMDSARNYAASEIVGRLVIPGDWVSVYRFYGKTEEVWSGDIADESAKAQLVRSLHNLQADGRFTDIGSALDNLENLVRARGKPERPKYLLLVTDEKQEAPPGTKYYSSDYSIEHPMLEYVRKTDMGSYRVITIGYNIASKIEGHLGSIMTFLSDPPERTDVELPGALQSADDSQGSAGSQQGSLASAREKAGIGSMPVWLVILLIAALCLIVIIIIILVIRSRHKDEEQKEQGAPDGV